MNENQKPMFVDGLMLKKPHDNRTSLKQSQKVASRIQKADNWVIQSLTFRKISLKLDDFGAWIAALR